VPLLRIATAYDATYRREASMPLSRIGLVLASSLDHEGKAACLRLAKVLGSVCLIEQYHR
jgi:hypothetical protein